MIGKYQVVLGADQLTSGMASSDYATDGALGTPCTGLNPYIVPGLIYPLAASTDISTNVADNLIASCEDSSATLPNNRYMIGNAANYYSYNGTAITKQATGSATYVQGMSDLISFDGSFFATTATETIDQLVKWNGGATINEAFQALTDNHAHHPMIAYQGLLYVGDGNVMSTLTANGSGTGAWTPAVLTLQSKEKIVALGIDPATGLMMVSIQTEYNISDTIPSLKAIYLYDGISSKPLRKILVDDLVTGFLNIEGIVYCGSGQTLGQWNGNGVTFLRKLQNVTLSNTDLVYKHHMANINRVLHVIDGKQILSYGTVIAGKPKAFFYTAQGNTTNHCSIVFPGGNNTLITAAPTHTVSKWDFSSFSAGTAQIFFNNIYFPRPIYIRRLKIITTGVTTTGLLGNVELTTEKNVTFQTASAGFIVSSIASPQYVFDFDFTNGIVINGIMPFIQIDTQNFGLVRATMYYDVAE